MPQPAVEFRDVSHSYGSHQALHQVSFEVKEGDFFGLLGPNGSGKTTLFRILSTLMTPSSGYCNVQGFNTTDSPSDVRLRLGVVFQQPSLDDELTVLQNLTFHGTLYGLKGQSLNERIHFLAERIGIQDRLKSRAGQLSGGLKRRADLIRGLLHSPEILLMDEPTTGLDPGARHNFWQLVSTLRKEEGLTLILATHLLHEASPCNQVVILNHGSVIVQGNPDELRNELGHSMLWLTSSSLVQLAERLSEEFNIQSHMFEDALCISDSNAIASLPTLYNALGDLILSATIRKPTLEDVFLTSTNEQEATPLIHSSNR